MMFLFDMWSFEYYKLNDNIILNDFNRNAFWIIQRIAEVLACICKYFINY